MEDFQIDDQKWIKGKFIFNRHFAASTKKMREMALSNKNYDPARLFKWGQMMSMAVIRLIKAAEKNFGSSGQKVMNQVLVNLGREIGQEILRDFTRPPQIKNIEIVSQFVSYINEEIWASPEVPLIINDQECLCDVLWCPHQDHYQAFDCRVQRYIVQGLLEAFQERTGITVDAKFTQIIPKGAKTCQFHIRIISPQEEREWNKNSAQLAAKALEKAGGNKKPWMKK